MVRELARPRAGDEDEGDAAFKQRGGEAEALAVRYVDVEEREIASLTKVIARIGEVVEHTDDLVPLGLDDGLQVERDEWIVLEDENTQRLLSHRS